MSPPFDAEKYKALMSGLECSEINSSELENEFTLGSEYYSKRYVSPVNQLRKISKLNYLCDISAIITDGDHGTAEYVEEGIPYLLSESVKEGYIDTSCLKTISKDKHQTLLRSELKPGDIVITKTGIYFGKSAVIPPSLPTSNTIAHVAKVRLKKEFNPYWVSTFMNSKYGYAQLRRRGIKATRPEIKLIEMQHILVPMASNELLESVENTVILANNYLTQSKKVFTDAQNLLSHDLGLDNWQPSEEKISIRSAKEVEQAGRWDAEYYQPKYDEVLSLAQKVPNIRLGSIVTIEKSIEPGSDVYQDDGISFLRVQDLTVHGFEKTEVHLDPINFKDAPRVKADTILLTKDGTVGIAYKAEKDEDVITSGAILHLRINDYDVNPDYLTLVLNSPVVKLQAEQDAGGSVIQHWKPSEIENVVIPLLPFAKQESISKKVQEAFQLRHQSLHLLNAAKRAVEIAIEEDESTALSYLKSQTDLYIDEKYSIDDSQQYLKIAEPDPSNETSNRAKGIISDE